MPNRLAYTLAVTSLVLLAVRSVTAQPAATGSNALDPYQPVQQGAVPSVELPTALPAADQRIRLAQSTEAIVSQSADSTSMPAGGPPMDRSMLQGYDFEAEWAPNLGANTLGMTRTSVGVKLGFPMPLVGGPLLVTPRYGIRALDGPKTIDAPARLHDFELGLSTFRKLNNRWTAVVRVNVGVYGDDYSLDDADAFQVSGFAFGSYQATPQLSWVFGAGVLNQSDIPVIPVVGFTYVDGSVTYEATFPRPRIVWDISSPARGMKEGIYLGAELGGGQWAVRRASGRDDVLNLNRYGVLLGYEQEITEKQSIRYELGYMFGNEIEYEESGNDVELDDSLFLRASFSF